MNVDDWLDEIFDEIDDLCQVGKFEKVDYILNNVDVSKCPTTILIGYLTITLPFIKEWHIKNTNHISTAREAFFNKVLDKLHQSNESEERIGRLLNGLGLKYYSRRTGTVS